MLALRNLAGHLKNTGPALTVPVDVLEDCLDQLSAGASTLDECLVRHPGHGSQLKTLLQTALFLKLGREVRPLEDFKIRARINLTQFMRFNPRLRQRARPLLIQAAATMTVLLMALFVTGTVRAQSALPGDEFYTWKRASEQVWRAVSLDAVATDIILSNRRASEWIAVANDPLLSESAKAGYFEVLNRFLSENNAQAYGRLLPDLYKQHDLLDHAGLSTPGTGSLSGRGYRLGSHRNGGPGYPYSFPHPRLCPLPRG